MRAFLDMSAERRQQVCAQVSAQMGLPERSVEKDFWVCWTLHQLFHLPTWGTRLTFKGGTSLSKGWKLIERFSEDIDIVIDREALGFDGDNAPETAPSRKQRTKRLKALSETCQDVIATAICPALQAAIATSLPTHLTWTLASDSTDPQTLLFAYPSAYDAQVSYIRPVVKIEMGARSDTEPVETITITPYIHESYPAMLPDAAVDIRAVSPLRTFWEKALLLHEENHRPPRTQTRKPYLARHYYDLYRLISAGIGDRAAADYSLFTRIIVHRQVFFHYTWLDYTTLTPRSLHLLPTDEQQITWHSDYAAMQKEMFYGDVPDFETIIATISSFQDQLTGEAT